MLGEHHDLHHELPEHKDAIHNLKMNDVHFNRLFTEYHDLTHQIESIEKNNSNVSDEHLKEMKTRRLTLKDDMLKMILKD
ncbi:MAG: Unknown protein [uncultured Thiotrichaceae bacterium]|uniref:GTP-binding protein n=1 Tax=uncultured Thiotrichaceae bacterium TaxID=298394 RepID=A0A6S6T275_9GAMM|nr:MAG: Unknown protein [uncultured Thiotrichaceae bacterium]